MLRMLLRPRYLALSALMVVIAAACVGFGTWQISRLEGKVSANDQLRHNAHAKPAPVAGVLPLVGTPDAPPQPHSVQFRKVTATGSYDASAQVLVRQRTVDVGSGDDAPGGDTGYLVLTPLDTGRGTLLVVRGFISGSAGGGSAPAIPAPPSGTVTVTARVQPAETRNDKAAELPTRQVQSINPVEQAARLARPVYDGYAELLAGQPGVGSLFAIPAPDLSNPAGGAIEPQHVAYIIQWYLFAALALAAPLAMVRAENKHAAEHEFDQDAEQTPTPTPADPAAEQPPPTAEQVRAQKLADRYGRTVR